MRGTYNPRVRQRLILNITIVIGLLGVAAYLSYQVALAFIQSQAVTDLRDRVFSEEHYPPPAAEIDGLVEEVEAKLAQLGGDELLLMQMHLLLLRASYYPERSVGDLRQAITIGQDFYAMPHVREELLAPELTRMYLFACLPAKLERWQAEALTVAPDQRLLLRFLQVYGRIVSDAPLAARALVEEELAQRGGLPDTGMLALASYTALGDLEAADEHADAAAGRSAMPVAFRYTYGDYLRERGRFAESEAELRRAIGAEDPSLPPDRIDPDDALLLATAIAGQRGLDDSDVRALLARAAQSTRYPRTAAGSAAAAAGMLWRATEDTTWWEVLLALLAEHPDDFAVALAIGDAALAIRPAADPATGSPGPPSAPDAITYAQRALALAASQSEHQAAHLLLARACAAAHPDGADGASSLTQSVTHLRRALGDPELTDAVNSERVPDYETFLLDEQVRATRAADGDYDRAIHCAVIDYLNRRQDLFTDLIKLPPLDYDWQPGP